MNYPSFKLTLNFFFFFSHLFLLLLSYPYLTKRSNWAPRDLSSDNRVYSFYSEIYQYHNCIPVICGKGSRSNEERDSFLVRRYSVPVIHSVLLASEKLSHFAGATLSRRCPNESFGKKAWALRTWVN